MEQSVACHVSSWLAGGVHTKPNTAGPNGNEFELEVRRGWRFWSHFAGGAGAVAILSAMEDSTLPLLWRARTQRVARSERKSSRQILSSKASRSLILGIGRTAKCAFLVYRCLAQRG
jgi:hypothetical protein